MTIHTVKGQESEALFGICMIAMRTLSTRYFAARWIRNMFQQLNEKMQRSGQPGRNQQSRTSPEPADSHADRTKMAEPTKSTADFQHHSSQGATYEPPIDHENPREARAGSNAEIPVTHGEQWSNTSTDVGMPGFGGLDHPANVLHGYDTTGGPGYPLDMQHMSATYWQNFLNANQYSGGNFEFRG